MFSMLDPSGLTLHVESPHGGFSVTPCLSSDTDTWACGINTACVEGVSNFSTGTHLAIALRPYQVAGLETGGEHVLTIEPTTVLKAEGSSNASSSTASVATTTITHYASGSAMYTAGQMAGVGVGVGIPLLLALVAAVIIILRLRRKLARPDSAATSTSAPLMQQQGVPSPHTTNYSSAKPYTHMQHPPPLGSVGVSDESEDMDAISHQVNEAPTTVRIELEGDRKHRF